ncbi:MAG: hypothetical protein ABI167_06530 [Nitrosospira sp.]
MNDYLLEFPIVGWDITTLTSEGIICIRLPFLPSEFERLAEADPGKPHAIHVEQARELRDALTQAILRIDDYESGPGPFEKSPKQREREQRRRNTERRKEDRRAHIRR